MMPEQQTALIRMGTHRFVRNMLRSMTVLLTVPFVVFFLVWGSLDGEYTTDWVMSPLTIVVAIAFSVVTLIIARIYYKRDVIGIFESFSEPSSHDSQTPHINPISSFLTRTESRRKSECHRSCD